MGSFAGRGLRGAEVTVRRAAVVLAVAAVVSAVAACGPSTERSTSEKDGAATTTSQRSSSTVAPSPDAVLRDTPLSEFVVYRDAPWANTMHDEQVAAIQPASTPLPPGMHAIPDFAGTTTNVVNGERRSRSATHGGAATNVWFVGAGGAFGVGQRDDFTVASELVRLGDAAGQPLTVHNLGVPENLFLDDEITLVRDRLRRSEPPDLVVFYDGFNDALFNWMYASTHGGTPLPREERAKDWVNEFASRPNPPRLQPEQIPPVVDHIVADYRGAQQQIRRELLGRGIAAEFFFQPDAFASAVQSADFTRVLRSAGIGPAPDNGLAAVLERSAAALASTVHNVRAAVAAVTTPFFADPSNMSERGATFTARALWPAVRRHLSAHNTAPT
ncbi:MAG: hypothetical protein ACKOYM_03300 [Actinomycetes bacterium]